MKHYDVIFIGSGHAAWHAALTLRAAGKTVALIEKDRIAGTCTNYGCNAKILLEYPFEVLEQASHYPNIIDTTHVVVNWENLMHFKHRVIDPLAQKLQTVFEQQGITIIKGEGRLVGKHRVAVNGVTLHADAIVLATGQHSHTLDIEGKALMHHSRDFLSMPTMPKHITMIGVGVISIEFASIAIKAGAQVEMIHYNHQPLRGFYTEHVEKLIEKLKTEGVKFHMGMQTKAVKAQGHRYVVVTDSGLTIETDYVLDATGRKPNVHGIGLEEVGVDFSERGIIVDQYMRTNIPHIYASGDVVEKEIPKLTPTATFESQYIAEHILGMNSAPIVYPPIPSVLYTLPRLAQVGVSIEAGRANKGYQVIDVPFGAEMRFEYKNEVEAEMTIVLDEEQALVGVAVYADDAPDLINLLTLIVNQRLTAKDLNGMIFAFPGASSGVIDQLKLAMLQAART